jgi:predicted DNA-binding protein (UPF0251 family)
MCIYNYTLTWSCVGVCPQVTTMYENVQREKDSLVGKVAAVEAEAKSLREQLASSQESCAAAVGVSSAQVYSNVLSLTVL